MAAHTRGLHFGVLGEPAVAAGEQQQWSQPAAVADGLGTQRKGRARAQARQWDTAGVAACAGKLAVVPGQQQVVTAPRARPCAVHAF